jgi:hypothetical protein
MDDDDRVGYCRPPKHAQFKPGQSGNPQGPRRRFPGMFVALRDVLEEPSNLPRRARRRKTSKFEDLARKLVDDALAGDAKIMRLVLRELGSKEARETLDGKFRDMMEEARISLGEKIAHMKRAIAEEDLEKQSGRSLAEELVRRGWP